MSNLLKLCLRDSPFECVVCCSQRVSIVEYCTERIYFRASSISISTISCKSCVYIQCIYGVTITIEINRSWRNLICLILSVEIFLSHVLKLCLENKIRELTPCCLLVNIFCIAEVEFCWFNRIVVNIEVDWAWSSRCCTCDMYKNITIEYYRTIDVLYQNTY